MKRFKLTKEEQALEQDALEGKFRLPTESEIRMIADAVAANRKDAVLNMRVNSRDLESIKQKAKRLGIPYQTLISELLHQFAA